jgi:hypothetical protein
MNDLIKRQERATLNNNGAQALLGDRTGYQAERAKYDKISAVGVYGEINQRLRDEGYLNINTDAKSKNSGNENLGIFVAKDGTVEVTMNRFANPPIYFSVGKFNFFDAGGNLRNTEDILNDIKAAMPSYSKANAHRISEEKKKLTEDRKALVEQSVIQATSALVKGRKVPPNTVITTQVNSDSSAIMQITLSNGYKNGKRVTDIFIGHTISLVDNEGNLRSQKDVAKDIADAYTAFSKRKN